MHVYSVVRKKKGLRYIILLLLIMTVLNIWNKFSSYYPPKPLEIRSPAAETYLTTYENSYWKPEKMKKILVWTPFFDVWDWVDNAERSIKSCSDLHVHCEVTRNRSELTSSDALVFHASDYWKLYYYELPQFRHPSQVWVLFTQEAPPSMSGYFPPHAFNWTMTYRRDSTMDVSYGGYVKKSTQEIQSGPESGIDNFASKTKMAVIHVSNCYDNARRYRIVHELSKHIDVDQFGHCPGRVVCDTGMPYQECANLFKPYKFYLAFENSYCRDYITEKYWQSQTDRLQIPVIATSKFNLELLPPHSYLNVFDFPTLKDLAEKMTEIRNNETLYNSYFEWKKYYKTGGSNGFCSMCKALHQNRTAQSYNLDSWIKHDSCSKPTILSEIMRHVERTLFDFGLW